MTAIAEGLTLEDTALAELTAGLRGHVVGRGDPPYDEARRIWNGSIDKRPALIAHCAGVADVMSAVKFARQHGLRVAVRSGGHSFPGLSVADDAFVIDLSLMKGVRVDPYERTARVQAGVLLGELDRETQVFGLAAPSGIVTHTGAAGLILGGGLGWVMRNDGLFVAPGAHARPLGGPAAPRRRRHCRRRVRHGHGRRELRPVLGPLRRRRQLRNRDRV